MASDLGTPCRPLLTYKMRHIEKWESAPTAMTLKPLLAPDPIAPATRYGKCKNFHWGLTSVGYIATRTKICTDEELATVIIRWCILITHENLSQRKLTHEIF